MAKHSYRCGNSTAVYSNGASGTSVPQDQERVRLTSRIHFARGLELPAPFRVLGTDGRGVEALVCLAQTRDEAAAQMRAQAERFVTIRLQQWVGRAFAGAWRTLDIRGRDRFRLSSRRLRR